MSIWLSTAMGATMLVSAPAIETFEYEIKKGDTCAKISTKIYGHRKHYEVIHQYNRWLGAQMPHHLEPGQKLVLPKTLPPDLPDAKVTAARRRVEARSPDTSNWSDAEAGLDLYRGWRVNTHERSSAEITFRDDSRIEMRESTLVIIYGGSRAKARRETAEAQLDRGALRSRLGAYTGKGSRAVTVTTPSAVAEFEGGETLVTVDERGTSRVANHGTGKAAVRSSGKKGGKVRIKPKMGSKVNKGKAPSKPKPLPPAPAWLDRGPTMFVSAGDLGGTIKAEWGAIAVAKSYRVEISREADGSGLVANRVVGAETHDFEVQQLPPGDYYASVATIDDDAFESPRSARRKLSVVPIYLLTPGSAPLPVSEGAEASAGPTPVLRGTRLDVPGDLKCSVGSGTPTDDPVLSEPGEHTINCVTADERTVPGFTVSVVEAKVAASAQTTTAKWGETVTTAFSVDATVPLPRRLWVEAPEGILVSSPVASGEGQWSVRVRAEEDVPSPAQLRVMADAGGQAVELGTLDLTIEESGSTPEPAVVVEAPPQRPERHMVEIGAYGGVMFPSKKHDLFLEYYIHPDDYQQLNTVASSLGLRFGYYPIRWVGAEVEASTGTTRTALTDERANLLGVRGHVLGQLPGRITPTLHVGGGTLGIAATRSLGRDADAVFYFGAGVKFYETRWINIRLDVRDTISAAYADPRSTNQDTGVAHYPEVMLGVSAVLGRRSAARADKDKSKRKRKRKNKGKASVGTSSSATGESAPSSASPSK